MKQTSLIIALVALCAALFAAPSQAADADSQIAYLRDVYLRFDKKLNDFLIDELNRFVDLYYDKPEIAEAHYLLGQIHDAEKDADLALANFAKVFCLFPKSEQQSTCVEGAVRVLSTDKTYRDSGQQLEKMLRDAGQRQTAKDRYYAYLEFLNKLDAKELHDFAQAEQVRFLRLYPKDPRRDHLVLWTAVSYANRGDSRESSLTFQMFDALYPESPSLPYARYTQAEILADELKERDKALAILEIFPEKFKGSRYVPTAIYKRAEIKEKMKNYEGAIDDFHLLARDYPDDHRAPEALMGVAELYTKRLKNYRQAVASYDEFLTRFPANPRGFDALVEAGELYEKKLKDNAQAVTYYRRAVTKYPENEATPKIAKRMEDLQQKLAAEN